MKKRIIKNFFEKSFIITFFVTLIIYSIAIVVSFPNVYAAELNSKIVTNLSSSISLNGLNGNKSSASISKTSSSTNKESEKSDYSGTSDTTTKTYGSGEEMASDIKKQADDFIDQGKNQSPISSRDITENLMPIANIIVYIATGVFIVVGAILGLKYMLAQDMQERAQIKKNLIWFVVAMIIVYGGVGIYNVVVSILNGIF